jgi:hypothetical protein
MPVYRIKMFNFFLVSCSKQRFMNVLVNTVGLNRAFLIYCMRFIRSHPGWNCVHVCDVLRAIRTIMKLTRQVSAQLMHTVAK